ncbi:tetratricopeptide repeat protein [candidate division WWE3 bacterium]|jgi:tetratricopeptide (TPR) repeat protein|uniref:Tetratricopeptide repeat protein n=1 Tax=candidate division WWE3 bacterium TaxID=2053526 RepID=A0A3A4ZDX0_UNCKA|nr:MAG: tetratricopeptide repeat protein [candidate division WWE3 bacterium]
MQANIALLAKKAIGEALKGNWESAIQFNIQILDKNPNNIDARLRLGRAYLQTKQFTKAKKMFKEVLQLDPINQVAQRNIDLINSKKLDLNNNIVNPSLLIKEPGTTVEISLDLKGRGITGENLVPGEILVLKIKKRSVDIFRTKNKKEVLIGTIETGDVVSRLNKAQELKASTIASVIKGKDKMVEILFKTSIPVFKSEKQDIRPYIKKGSLDEPDAESEELEIGV